MANESHLTERERADLVAYLDGELKGEAARALEAKLSLHPEARAEAEALKRTWDMLDYLPRVEPSPRFTERTLSKLSPVSAVLPGSLAAPSWRRWAGAVAWFAAVIAFFLAGMLSLSAFHLLFPSDPGERELVQDLRIIENKRLYDVAESVDFLRELAHPDLFAEDGPGS
jgi:anti-sigma factor RsiW